MQDQKDFKIFLSRIFSKHDPINMSFKKKKKGKFGRIV